MDELISVTIGITVWEVLRLLMLIFLGIYIVFAIVVLKQVRLMTQTVKAGFELPIEIFATIHLLIAIAIFLLAFII